MIKDFLSPMLKEAGIELDEDKLLKFEHYGALLKEWNEKINLTAIIEDEGIAEKHFFDSLTLLLNTNIPKNATVADVGTGAGFPGVALAIARPDIKLTLIDSLQKRINFLEMLTEKLGVKAKCLHLRAEDAGRDKALREQFDYVTARAVASMPVLSEYCFPLVKVGGTFAAMKGNNISEELKTALPLIKDMGGEEPKVISFSLPTAGERNIITVKKLKETPKKYPEKGVAKKYHG